MTTRNEIQAALLAAAAFAAFWAIPLVADLIDSCRGLV